MAFDKRRRRRGTPGSAAPPGRRWCALAVVLLLPAVHPALAAGGTGSGAGSDKHAGVEAKGTVVAIDPARLSVLGDDGTLMRFRTRQDFTRQVSMGLEVTVWYTVKDDGSWVESLQSDPKAFFLPPEQIRGRIKKVIILPSSEVPGADGLFTAMRSYLQAELGWYVPPSFLAEEIRARRQNAGLAGPGSQPAHSTLDAMNPETGEFDLSSYTRGATAAASQPDAAGASQADTGNPSQDQASSDAGRESRPVSTLDAIDPRTGQFDITRYLEKPESAEVSPLASLSRPSPREQGLIPALASEARVDAVLEANVVAVEARLDRLVARWDGVEEPLAGKGSQTVAKLSIIPARGNVPATTVVLKLWDAQGRLLWTDRLGFAVLAARQGMSGKLRE